MLTAIEHPQKQVQGRLSHRFPALPPPQVLRFGRKEGEASELEARETGDEQRGITGRRKKRGDTTSRILSPSLPPLRARHFRSERGVWERGSSPPVKHLPVTNPFIMVSGVLKHWFTLSFKFKAIFLEYLRIFAVQVYLKIRLRASKIMPSFDTLEYE